MCIDIDGAFHAKVHVRNRVERFQEFAIRDGGTAMQIHNLRGIVDLGVQLKTRCEGLT
jgi:3-deoxy-D-manno-octulosonate 8-phosphate phosphatase KdsC-like HAD superfamily phosphatase